MLCLMKFYHFCRELQAETSDVFSQRVLKQKRYHSRHGFPKRLNEKGLTA